MITLSGGLIDQVKFYTDPILAIEILEDFAITMNPEDQDAAVYSQAGLVVNAKAFLDENDEYVENSELIEHLRDHYQR